MKSGLLILAAALTLAAQPKRLVDAQVQTRAVSGSLEKHLQTLATAQPQPAWAGYMVPAARGRNFGCDSYWRNDEFAVAGGVVHLEPPREVMVLFRFHNNQVSQIRTLAPDCEMSASGAPFHWLTGVQPADSVAALSSFVKSGDRLAEPAVGAIGLHGGTAADAALEKFIGPGQPENVRGRAARWIAWTRGRNGLELLKKRMASEPEERARKGAVSAIASSSDPEAVNILIEVAKSDRAPAVRSEALRALGRKGGANAVAAINHAINNDADRDVRRAAVLALRSLPDGTGIPVLIQTARSHRDYEVRKHAMSALGQTRDPRASAYLEDVLKR